MSTPSFVVLGFFLFCLGLFGVLARRNFIVILLSIELIFAAAGINFIAFSRLWNNLAGQVFTVFLIAVAAGEAAIGLGLLIAMVRTKKTSNIDEVDSLRG